MEVRFIKQALNFEKDYFRVDKQTFLEMDWDSKITKTPPSTHNLPIDRSKSKTKYGLSLVKVKAHNAINRNYWINDPDQVEPYNAKNKMSVFDWFELNEIYRCSKHSSPSDPCEKKPCRQYGPFVRLSPMKPCLRELKTVNDNVCGPYAEYDGKTCKFLKSLLFLDKPSNDEVIARKKGYYCIHGDDLREEVVFAEPKILPDFEVPVHTRKMAKEEGPKYRDTRGMKTMCSLTKK